MNAPRPLRLDCAATGPAVALLGSAGDGYVRVRSLNRGLTFETLASRLQGSSPAPLTSNP